MATIFEEPGKDLQENGNTGNDRSEQNQGLEKSGGEETKSANKQQNSLDKSELPDSSNESTGKMGSGQRQDSN